MSLTPLQKALSVELHRILDYWVTVAIDKERGGVWGRINNYNQVFPQADKGVVLHARVLWTFSAAYPVVQDAQLRSLADDLFTYMDTYFWDAAQGGVYWSITADGQPAATKKQVYAQAFALYAFSEYYRLTGNAAAKHRCFELYELIQLHSYDAAAGGYLEAFTAGWQPLDDLRLSAKDANEKKTMNTHLHVLEAYTNLYRCWPDEELAGHLRSLLDLFYYKIIDRNTGHLQLFFDEHWQPKGDLISFGHDMEAGWLLLEAAEILNDAPLVIRFKALALQMTQAVLKGIDGDGGLWYEYDRVTKKLIKEKHWWPQAEALVGFINAWQISGDTKYADHALYTWQFIQQHMIDTKGGEWFWGVRDDYSIMNEDKVGLWKCPYHNGRACMEGMRRLG